VKTLQRHRSPRIPWGFGSENSEETTLLRTQARTRIHRARRGKRGQRLRPLSFGEFSQGWEESAVAQEGAASAVGIAEKIWTVGRFSRPGRRQEKRTEGGDREPLDLIQKSCQLSDWKGGARGLTLLTPGKRSRQASGYRRS
jgi:hypothetical protein